MISLIAGWLVKRSLANGGALTLPYARRLAKLGLIAAAIVLVVGAFLIWDHLDDKAAVAEASADAVATARGADAEARATVDSSLNSVESSNDEARRAAEGSDDPLADGLRSLR